MRYRVTEKESNIKKIPGFLSDLDTRVVSENKFELLKPLKYNSALSLLPIIVPQGFITNFASFILVNGTISFFIFLFFAAMIMGRIPLQARNRPSKDNSPINP